MSADNGRFYIQGKNGKVWCVEPIGDPHIPWGDVNPATKELEKGTYGKKYRGSIDEEESIITKENGYEHIHYTGVGCSPLSLIEQLENEQ